MHYAVTITTIARVTVVTSRTNNNLYQRRQ